MTWFVYILKCSDDSYYTGYTEYLEVRIQDHNSGRACKYTFSRRPVSLVYYENYDTKEEAKKRECQIKKWSRSKKEALISENTDKLKILSKCQTIHGKSRKPKIA